MVKPHLAHAACQRATQPLTLTLPNVTCAVLTSPLPLPLPPRPPSTRHTPRGRPAASTSASPIIAAPKAARFGTLGLGALVSGISGLMGGVVPPPPAPPQDGSRVVLPMAQSQVEQVEEL